MVAAHVFVDDLSSPALTSDDRHHLTRVLRLRDGEAVTASDGRGGVVDCVFRDDGVLEPVDDPAVDPRPQPALTVGFALVKHERPEWIVQKLTEVGIDRIVPFVADRTVVRWSPDKAVVQAERWRRVAREASMQSRRAWLPAVDDVRSFDEVVAGSGVALAAPEGDPPTLATPTVLIGPEGGWSPRELAAVAPKVGLGPTVLRAETAAVGAGVLLAALRDGLVAPVERRH